MTTIAQHQNDAQLHCHINQRLAHDARLANLLLAVLKGLGAAFGVLLGTSIKDLTTRD